MILADNQRIMALSPEVEGTTKEISETSKASVGRGPRAPRGSALAFLLPPRAPQGSGVSSTLPGLSPSSESVTPRPGGPSRGAFLRGRATKLRFIKSHFGAAAHHQLQFAVARH